MISQYARAVARAAVDPSILVHRRHGTLVSAPRSIVSGRIRHSIANGSYESVESKVLTKLIRADDRVLELGAGLGFIAALVGSICRPAKYLAVEADPRLIPVIARTISLNGVKAQVLHGVAETDGALLGVGVTNFAVEPEFWASRRSASGIEVPLLDLNSMLAEQAISVIIADIEGGEATLFAQADLSKVRAVCIEIHPDIGTAAVQGLFTRMHDVGMTYDGRLSSGTVVTFSRTITP